MINDGLLNKFRLLRDIIVFVAAAGILFGWYFTTKANTKAIEELKTTKLDEAIYNVQMINIQKDIRKIETHLGKIEEYIREYMSTK